MQAKGFELVEPRSEADLQLSFTIGSREKISATSYPDPYWPYYGGWGAGWGGGGYYMGMSSVDVRQYTEGILAIDLLDVATRKPVWHGKATREITKKRPENSEESLNEVVADILQYFPPAPEEGEPAATTE